MTIVQAEKAAEAAAAMDVDEETPSNAAAQPKADQEKPGGKLHVLGIGGRRAKRGSAKATGSKKTPGEIRIQKGEAVQHNYCSLLYGKLKLVDFEGVQRLTLVRFWYDVSREVYDERAR